MTVSSKRRRIQSCGHLGVSLVALLAAIADQHVGWGTVIVMSQFGYLAIRFMAPR